MEYRNIIKRNIIDTIHNFIFTNKELLDSTGYVQSSNFITIFYQYNKDKNNNSIDYINNYPTVLKSKKVFDTLHNLLKLQEPLLKYILFKIQLPDTIVNSLQHINEMLFSKFPNEMKVLDRGIYFSLENTIVNSHYDRVDRFLLQIKGTKKILLLPPKHIHSFREYPLLHIANRNFQIRSIKDNNSAKDDIQEYLLNEGDGLFIPKYWIHQIETDSESISLVTTYVESDNSTLESTHFYEIGKEIDYYLYNIDGMNSIFKWNKHWFYHNKYPDDMLIHYNNLSSLIKHIFVEYLNETLFDLDLYIENIFYKHSLSYEIFIKNNKEDIVIPRY